MDEQVFLRTFLFAEASVFSLAGKDSALSPRAPTGPPVSDALFQSMFQNAVGKKSFLQKSISFRSVSLRSMQNQPSHALPPVKTSGGGQTESVKLQTQDAPVNTAKLSVDDSKSGVTVKTESKPAVNTEAVRDAKGSVNDASAPVKKTNDGGDVKVSDSGGQDSPMTASDDVKDANQVASVNETGAADNSKDDETAVKSAASRVEFLLVQFMFFLQFGMDGANTDAAKNENPQANDALKLAASMFDVQSQSLIADAAGGGQNVVLEDASQSSVAATVQATDVSADLLKQLQQLQDASEKLFDGMTAELTGGDNVSSSDVQGAGNSPALVSLNALLQELQGVVEDVKVTQPAVNDAGALKLKQLAAFAEEVKLLMQKAAENLAAQTESSGMNSAAYADGIQTAAQSGQDIETAMLQGGDEADNVNGALNNGAQTVSESQPVTADGAQKNSNVNAPENDDGDFHGALDAKGNANAMLDVVPDDVQAGGAFLKAAENEASKELQLKNVSAESQAVKAGQSQTIASFGKAAAQMLKSTAALPFGMEFKEMLNAPKAFAEELQKMLNLQDISLGSVQTVVQDTLISAALAGEKLQLALSDMASHAEETAFSLKDFAKDTGSAGLKPSPTLQPLLSEFQRALDQSSTQTTSAAKESAPAVKTEDNLLQFSQSLVKSGQILLSTGVADMRLRLKPEHLGDLRLRIMMEEGILSATLQAQSQQVKEILESSLSTLKQSLKDHGIEVQKFVVTTGNPGDYAQAGQNAETNAAWNEKNNGQTARGFSGRDEKDDAAVLPAAQTISRAKLSQIDYFV